MRLTLDALVSVYASPGDVCTFTDQGWGRDLFALRRRWMGKRGGKEHAASTMARVPQDYDSPRGGVCRNWVFHATCVLCQVEERPVAAELCVASCGAGLRTGECRHASVHCLSDSGSSRTL
jgi:hypothetical protein